MKHLKWPLFLLAVLGGLFALFRAGFFEKVLGPWAGWAKFIGYFD